MNVLTKEIKSENTAFLVSLIDIKIDTKNIVKLGNINSKNI